jgi:hypothetical protein
MGRYQGSDVLIEWKTADTGGSKQNSIVLDQRINLIARLLRSDLKPEAMRTLPCTGVVGKKDLNGKYIWSIIFDPPPSTSYYLQDLIRLWKDHILGDCLTIAQALSRALLYLHLAGWLHRGIRSDNVLFLRMISQKPCPPIHTW